MLCRYRSDFAVIDLGRYIGLAPLIYLMASVLLQLAPEKALTVLVVLVFGCRSAGSCDESAGRQQIDHSSSCQHD